MSIENSEALISNQNGTDVNSFPKNGWHNLPTVTRKLMLNKYKSDLNNLEQGYNTIVTKLEHDDFDTDEIHEKLNKLAKAIRVIKDKIDALENSYE